MTQEIRLDVIPNPPGPGDSRTVLVSADLEFTDPDLACIEGERDGPGQVCGQCDRTLVRGVPPPISTEDGQPPVIRCPTCGTFNEMIPAEALPPE